MSGVRVVKLGGSLLGRSDWPRNLRTWISSQPTALNLIVVGGGEIVEAVRQLDREHHFDAGFAHWLCVDLLEFTAQIAAELLPELEVISSAEHLRERVGGPGAPLAGSCWVQVAAFYSRHRRTDRLPEDWNTTSDALAAFLASEVNADELVLLKSVEAPGEPTTAEELAGLGIIDAASANIIGDHVSLRIVKLSTLNSI